jgi:general secretion pathway protein J
MTARLQSKGNATAGFTLLEMLVSMALLGMILGALATLTAQWLPNWNRGMSRIESNEQIALGLDRLTADLAAAEYVSVRRDTPLPLFDGSANAVTFVRTTHNPNSRLGLEIVRIAEIQGAAGLRLMRSTAPFMPISSSVDPRTQPAFGNPVVLLRAPYQVTFAYAGTDRIWHELWRQQSKLPYAIRLTLQDASTRRALSISTATTIHVGLPSDCIRSKSAEACRNRRLQPINTTETGPSRS